MKIKITCILFWLFFISNNSNAQAVTSYAGHPSYTTSQLRYKNCIEVQPNGSLVYIGYRDAGLHILQTSSSTWVAFDTLNSSIPSNKVTALELTSTNQLWVGTNKGLCLFNGSNFTVFNTSNSGIVTDTITSLFATASGLWIGTRQGLSFYNGTFFTNYTIQNSGLINSAVNCIEQDSIGNFYFGTNGGYSYYDGTNWFNTTKSNSSLISDTITSIQYISNKTCWMMTAKGLSKISYGNIISFVDSTCYNPDSYSAEHNLSYGLTKKDSGLYAVSSSPPVVKKLYENNLILYYNDTLQNYNTTINTSFGVHSVFDNSGILWIICRMYYNDVLMSFNESISTGSLVFNTEKASSKTLNGNLVSAVIHNRGDMFWDLLQDSKYEVPRCSGKHSNFASGLWLGGYDQNGILHTSAMSYRQSFSLDYWPGPLDTINGATDIATVNAFDNIWKLEKDTINNFITNYLNGNVTNGSYPVPYDILTYPAVGTGNFSRNLAPFFDYNNDGNYNPYDGDYPLIKGDQQLFWIFNDNDTLHTETNGIPLGVEIHGFAYSYYCPQFTINDVPGVVNYTTFYRYEIYNRSLNFYDSVFIGIRHQPILGEEYDNYTACDTLLNIAYAYNADNDDASGTSYGYGFNPPIIALQILNGPIPNPNDSIDNDNDGVFDEPGETNMLTSFLSYDNAGGPTDDPSTPLGYYGYLCSRWQDGSHITVGGNGYNPGSVNYTNHMYTGTPYTTVGWTEASAGSIPGPRRSVSSSGPFSLAPGQMKSIDYAMVFTWDSTAANGLNTSIAKNIVGNQKIKQWFDEGVLGNCNLLSANNAVVPLNSFQVFPNPAEDVLQLETNFNSSTPSSYIVTDITGRIVTQNKFIENIEIPIQHLSPSVYLVTVTNGNYVLTRKFVKH